MSGVRSPPSLPVIRTVRKGCFFYTRSEGSIPPMFQSSDDGASSISIRFIALRNRTVHRTGSVLRSIALRIPTIHRIVGICAVSPCTLHQRDFVLQSKPEATGGKMSSPCPLFFQRQEQLGRGLPFQRQKNPLRKEGIIRREKLVIKKE